MEIKVNDNAFGAVLIIGVVLAIISITHCGLQVRRFETEVDKAHISAGQCQNAWGTTWSKCQ